MELLDSPGKATIIEEVSAKFPDIHTFVETGTASGEQGFLLRDTFLDIVTIESDADLYDGAMNRLLRFGNVRVLWGDSERMLAHVLKALDRPCVIFLDAHEIADAGESALAMEMFAIAHDPHDHVVLVDDVRLCTGEHGWLTEDQLVDYARMWGHDYHREDDIARLTP